MIKLIRNLSVDIQHFLYKRKIYWHNFIKDECTAGFECCLHKHTKEEQNLLKSIARASMENMDTVYVSKDLKII